MANAANFLEVRYAYCQNAGNEVLGLFLSPHCAVRLHGLAAPLAADKDRIPGVGMKTSIKTFTRHS